MSNAVFLRPDENGNWGKVGVDTMTTVSDVITFQNAATSTTTETRSILGYSTVILDVVITGTASVVFYAATDGVNFSQIYGVPTSYNGTFGAAVSSTQRGLRFDVVGFSHFRTYISSYTSGTVTITARLSTSAVGNIFKTTSTGNLAVAINDSSATPIYTSANFLDGDSGFYFLASSGMAYNGSTYDRLRSNTTATALSSAARTSATNSSLIRSYNARGIIIYLNVSAASGTGGLSLQFQAYDSISGGSKTINSAVTAVTSTGLYTYAIYAGSDPTNTGHNQVSNSPIPYQFRVAMAVGDSSSYTYSVGYNLIV